MRKRKLPIALGLAFLGLAAFLTLVQGQSTSPRFVTGLPGLAMESSAVLIAVPLANMGTITADDVKVTGVSLGTQQRVRPSTLPLLVGSIAGGKDSVLQLAFSAAGMTTPSRYTLVIQGTYRVGTSTLGYQVSRLITLPPPSEASVDTQELEFEVETADTPYPPGPNEVEDDDANPERRIPLPHGLRQNGDNVPLNDSTDSGPDLPPLNPVPTKAVAREALNDPLSFVRASTAQTGSSLDHSGVSVDVAGANGTTRLVFLTFNTQALLSTDGGANFTAIDPTTVFPTPPSNLSPGLCCDQVVHYVPSINRVIWLLQYSIVPVVYDAKGKPAYGPNMIRIASASPEAIIAHNATKWKYWTITSTKWFGQGVDWIDYPDLAYTGSYLHIGFDRVSPNGGRYFVLRIPLDEIAAAGKVHIRGPLSGSSTGYGGHLAQDSPDAAYWFGHNTDSAVDVYEWRDDRTVYTKRTLGVKSWTSADDNALAYWTPTPSGSDWLGFGFGNGAIRGATVVGTDADIVRGDWYRHITIAWTGGRGGGFLYPHIRLADIWRTDFHDGTQLWAAAGEMQIWNQNYAYSHPYLTTNRDREVGIAMAFGGPMQDATALTGIVGDKTYRWYNKSNWSTGRWSDYTTIRKHWPNDRLFSVSDVYVTAKVPMPAPGNGSCCISWHQYRLFGRSANVGSTY